LAIRFRLFPLLLSFRFGLGLSQSGPPNELLLPITSVFGPLLPIQLLLPPTLRKKRLLLELLLERPSGIVGESDRDGLWDASE